MVNARAKLELRRAASWRAKRRSPAGSRASSVLVTLLAARTWIGEAGKPCQTQGANGGLDLGVRAIQSRPPDGAGKPQPPLHPKSSLERGQSPGFALGQELRRVFVLPFGQAVAGDIGVLRKTASRAATRSETAMPATQAFQPNISKITPSTALPISPPKK